jgi:DNA-binding beta-propeller fold protein YncE
MVPNYENTLSVIDIPSFAEVKRIPVAINLHRVRADKNGLLWVTSRGDYFAVPAKLYCVDPKNDQVIDSLDIAVSDLDIAGDSLYACATAWDYLKMENTVSYSVVDINTRKMVCDNFITDGTDQNIKKPYGVKVHPQTREIYLTDAKNYVTPGTLYCFSPAGVALWSVRTGDIPAHIAFLKIPREIAQNGEN